MLKKGDLVRLTDVDKLWAPEVSVGDVGVVRSLAVQLNYALITIYRNGIVMSSHVENLEKIDEPDQ
jgi:hypothetical protein